ncbi:hypothetical protein [Allokutzneria oryzae]|uniref:Uncharacterized protein n=1 Tax=Allokutzneria oryzae TaxID=1378989 RepID=A0ABV6A119_9PSEU
MLALGTRQPRLGLGVRVPGRERDLPGRGLGGCRTLEKLGRLFGCPANGCA